MRIRVLFSVLYCFTALSVTAQGKLTLVQGTVNSDKTKSMVLFDVQNGEKLEMATARINGQYQFAFALPNIRDGFYYLSNQGRRSFIRLYLKAGDKFQIAINDSGNYAFVQPTPENKLLKEWNDFAEPVTRMSIFPRKDTATYASFFPILTAFLPKADAFKKKIKTPNAAFNDLLKNAVDFDIEHAALKFMLTPNSKFPGKDEMIPYYNTIVQPNKFTNTAVLNSGNGVDLIMLYSIYKYGKVKNPDSKERPTISEMLDFFGNDTIKGIFVENQLPGYRSLEKFNQEIEPVKKYLVTDTMQARYARNLKRLSTYRKGDKAFNFSYPDSSGNVVTLASLKGKVVLVDVWATWCGPCKAELPHLKKLEEELRDKDIAFVSISVDEEKDKEKWKNFVAKEQLRGIQLYAKGWSEFTRYYDIHGIPRFLVFDKEGKIVTVDSPRPSAPELKELLLNTLKN
ncbi:MULTISPECIES: TlpA family protein disulfide reductase [Niastella]|uniref:TlpA family protein disulfide reductase n=1 Tax=Niastella soli TaxID=2821487 RepID=A0ABS3YUT9_9BACT|nr:TlpA disulfide reductase family protein [Niastella soli]MBO9201594.1 TlpA family protein disulfide reductase [Niastella soli]